MPSVTKCYDVDGNVCWHETGKIPDGWTTNAPQAKTEEVYTAVEMAEEAPAPRKRRGRPPKPK